MKVWVIENYSHGETYIYSEDSNLLEVPYVKDELSYLVGAYDGEREEFMTDYADGSAWLQIEERFEATLTEVLTA